MSSTLRGALSGMVATILMSLVMALGKALGLMGKPPPKQITQRAAKKAGIDVSRLPQPVVNAAALLAHFGYGAACGAVFAFARRLLPSNWFVGGAVYGGLLWAASYIGLMPALGLYPPPERDSDSRTAVMIAAHGVFGISLARLSDRSD